MCTHAETRGGGAGASGAVKEKSRSILRTPGTALVRGSPFDGRCIDGNYIYFRVQRVAERFVVDGRRADLQELMASHPINPVHLSHFLRAGRSPGPRLSGRYDCVAHCRPGHGCARGLEVAQAMLRIHLSNPFQIRWRGLCGLCLVHPISHCDMCSDTLAHLLITL